MLYWTINILTFILGAGMAWAVVEAWPSASEKLRDPEKRRMEQDARRWAIWIMGGCAIFGFFSIWNTLRDGRPPQGYLWSESGDSGDTPGLYYHDEHGRDHRVRLEGAGLRFGKSGYIPDRVTYYGETIPPHLRDHDEEPRYGYPVD